MIAMGAGFLARKAEFMLRHIGLKSNTKRTYLGNFWLHWIVHGFTAQFQKRGSRASLRRLLMSRECMVAVSEVNI
jgi:hypothetical protein